MKYIALLNLLLAVTGSSVVAHPGHHHIRRDNLPQLVSRQLSGDVGAFSAAKFPDVQKVLNGNAEFRATRDAAAIQALVNDGQKPPFMMFSCSDSRVPEQSIFNADPGTFFMSRNIANQYKPGDESAQSAMAYGVRVLGAQHVVVMGHYGCGGIAASIASRPTEIDVATHIVQTWIGDVRQLYLSSNRTEIVAMRERNLAIEASGGIVEEPDVGDPGFRALVEENVKQQVKRISESSVITVLEQEVVTKLNVDGSRKVGVPAKRAEEGAELIPVFVHGWVHDIETGGVIDLGISTGPAGFENFVPSVGDVLGDNPISQESPAALEQNSENQVQQINFGSSSDVIVHGVTEIPVKRTVPVYKRSERWQRRA